MRETVRQPAAPVCLAVLALLLAQAEAAPAQSANPSQATAELPRLDLTDAQRQTIYISVTNQNLRNAAPPNFQPVVGAAVPGNIELENIPKTIVELIPATEGFRLVRILNQVVIVDPQSRRVVDVISGKRL